MRLLIVTDIHGRPTADRCLSRHLPGAQCSLVRTFSLSELLDVKYTGERLHRELVENDGFIRAAERLARLSEAADVALGYSAGGTVLWHGVLNGLAVDRLICLSSTRLRDVRASAMPKPALVVFGKDDPNRPRERWASGSAVECCTVSGAGHDFYAIEGPALRLCLAWITRFLNLM
ncbi:alpha/beta hydrolase [Ensifer sp. BR816]|uniref:alpha/beta hydrolase n=1 Tax=Rhizobium sp. (strain BR816) TaxID=1057002 RepID=UPI00036A1123|nr:alpha/beta hydrolase [Ensifer sp. BR816]